jgi:hypothetical protein
MFNKDKMKATGKVNVVVRDENGKVKEEFTVPNLVVDDGLEYIAARMVDASIPTAMSHMAVGTDNTAAGSSDTALGAEAARVAFDSAPSVTANSVAYVATYPAGTGTAALTEAGILNAGSGGTLLCRTVFSVINKGASDSMTITWTITIS